MPKASQQEKGLEARQEGGKVWEVLLDLLTGPTNVIQTSGQIYQSLDLPWTPPRTSGTNAASTWLVRAAGHRSASESGNIWEAFNIDGLQVLSLARNKWGNVFTFVTFSSLQLILCSASQLLVSIRITCRAYWTPVPCAYPQRVYHLVDQGREPKQLLSS